MAKIDLKFLDAQYDTKRVHVMQSNNHILLTHYVGDYYTQIKLDKSTAIKFSKTLRTEIAKITSQEKEGGHNG